jgi:predicted alpha/beta hydrolase
MFSTWMTPMPHLSEHAAMNTSEASSSDQAQAQDASPSPLTVHCADGTPLQAHVFAARGEQTRPPVLIGPATGVPQRFYFRFADWLAAQGHTVLVFDYRGIGQSLRGPLKGSGATLIEWGQQDLVAALDALLTHTGAEQVMLIGHSAGGQMMGLMPNQHRIARVVGVATSTGWFKAMRPGFKWQARFALRLAVPLASRFKGYGPTSWFGLGEDLPSTVARQWGQWCEAGGYATHAVKGRPDEDFHGQVRMPITVLHASDDDIANAATVADLLRTFPNAPQQTHLVKPKAHGLKALGHINWFRSSHQAVWPLIAQALHAD